MNKKFLVFYFIKVIFCSIIKLVMSFMKLLKNKKYIIMLIILILVIIVVGTLLFKINNDDKNLKKETYVAYVKINPLVKLTFDASYYECGNELCNYKTEVTKIDLLNEDANIYENLDIKDKNLSDVIASLIIIANTNSIDVNSVGVTTNLSYNLDGISNDIKEKIKDIETEVEIKFNYESVINEEKILENEIVKSYIVSFDSDTGSVVNNITVLENNTLIKPADPKKDGYTFIEWQLDGKTYDFNSKIDKDITLKAKWQKINNNTSKEDNKAEEKKCTSKKFDKKYSYVYDAKEVCVKEGNNAFNNISDNVDSAVFAYSCKEILDECGKTWYGVIFYKWSESLGEYEVNY